MNPLWLQQVKCYDDIMNDYCIDYEKLKNEFSRYILKDYYHNVLKVIDGAPWAILWLDNEHAARRDVNEKIYILEEIIVNTPEGVPDEAVDIIIRCSNIMKDWVEFDHDIAVRHYNHAVSNQRLEISGCPTANF